MNQHYTYFLILALSLAGPLALSFDKKVAFFKKWNHVFPAMILPAAFFIAWDIIFTHNNIWSFNEEYITGFKFVNIPVEEVLFFFVVPYCSVFIFECIRSYFPAVQTKPWSLICLRIIAVSVLILSVIFYSLDYTFYTGIFLSAFIFILFLFRKSFTHFNTSAFIIAYLIILLPFMAVNGVLTALPVVIYNNAENLGLRIGRIPAEDLFYGMLLVLMNLVIYERLKNRLSPIKD